MQTGGMLRRLLLAGTFLSVCGTPVYLPDLPPTQDSNSVTTTASSLNIDIQPGQGVFGSPEHVMLNVGPAGGADPHGRHTRLEGIVTQTAIGDGLGGRSGTGRETWSQKREKKMGRQMRDRQRQADGGGSEQLSAATGGEMDASTSRRTALNMGSSSELSWPASLDTSYPSADIAKLTVPPAVFALPQTSTTQALWSHDGATTSTQQDPMLPEIAPLPKEESTESLWTEAARPSGADTAVPLSQDEATEGTMSSESLPLIFEPLEDVPPEGASAVTLLPGRAQPIAAMATGKMPLSEVDMDQLVTVETDSDDPSNAPPLLVPEWTSQWQTSGTELREPISSPDLSVSQQRTSTEAGWDQVETGAVRISNLEENSQTTGRSLSSFQHSLTTVTMTTHQRVPKTRSGLEEMESEEEQDEDEDDEHSEDSVEDDSEEEMTEAPNASSAPPPYSIIPPPPVWVQRNQGLMRSWVELIREKAGYVSGMLAPVGIGITGALLIVGALYSVRMIHRKRRNSFKHQRRKVRQPEQPREPGTSRQDQAMLLADSSEDEF